MGFFGSIGKYFGASPKGKNMSAEESATEDSIQAALDKMVVGDKAFGNRTMKAGDAEDALRKQGVLPPGWRLRESDSTSSGYRPTQAANKKVAAIHAGQIAAAALTGGSSLAVQAAVNAGLGAAQGATGGGGLKGALLGGATGAGGALIPGGATAGLGRKIGTQAGLGAARGAASGGGVKGALLGAATGAGGAALGNYTPALSSNTLAQKGITFGVNSGLNAARTGKFDPKSLLVGGAQTFLPDAASKFTSNPTAQRAINYGGGLALNKASGQKFNPIDAGFGALRVGNPQLAAKLQGVIPGRQAGGPVKKDEPVIVGEGGPEVIVPEKNGTVLPSATPKALAPPVAPVAAPSAAPPAPAAKPAAAPPVAPPGGAEDDSPGFWDKYGKPIATGGGIAAGMYLGKRAQDAAAVRSPEEQEAIRNVTGPGGSPETARSLMMESRPYISKPASYYQTLLNGNRAAMTQAVAPERAALNESYRGATTNLARSGIRGAQRDQLAGQLNQQRAGQVAGLTTGVQPAAAAALAGLGQNLQANAVPLYNSSNNFYANLLNSGLANRQFAAKEGGETGAQFGKLAADLGNLNFGKGKKPTPAKGPQGGPPPPPPDGVDYSDAGVPAPPGYYDEGPLEPGYGDRPPTYGGDYGPQPDYSYADDSGNPYGYPE